MKLLVAAIAFGVTMGVLFLTARSEKKELAQNITEDLTAQILNNREVEEITPTSIKKVTLTVSPNLSAPGSSIVAQNMLVNTPSPKPSPTPIVTPKPVAKAGEPTSQPQLSPSPIAAPTPPPATPPPTGGPTPTPQPETSYQITIISLTSPVQQNTVAKLDIKTAPEARCGIKVALPSGGQSSAKGLEPKTADSGGNISWSWRINWNTKPGTATIDISCSKDFQNFSETLQMEIVG